jgi:uncharacterized protein YgbK (DUF1537 family)
VIVTPAFPENGRTVFKGHLFVGDLLLSDSPMRHHPLTPMTDANLVRVMQAQCRREVSGWSTTARGARAPMPHPRSRWAHCVPPASALRHRGCRVTTTTCACWPCRRDQPLVVAGSGLAIGIPALHGLAPSADAARCRRRAAAAAVVSGSCSAATNAQVAAFIAAGGAGFAIDPLRSPRADLCRRRRWPGRCRSWARRRCWSTPRPSPRGRARRAAAARRRARPARWSSVPGAHRRRAWSRRRGQLVVAGGETSGACVQALGVTQLRIGPQIDPGVPWCHAAGAGAAPGA